MRKLLLIFSAIALGLSSCDKEEDEHNVEVDPTESYQVEVHMKVSTDGNKFVDAAISKYISSSLDPDIILGGQYVKVYDGTLGTLRDELDDADGKICYVQGLYNCPVYPQWSSGLITLASEDYKNIPDGKALYVDVIISANSDEDYYCLFPPIGGPTHSSNISTHIDNIPTGPGSYNCSRGSCTYVSSGGQYSTLSECETACSGPATGRIMIYATDLQPCATISCYMDGDYVGSLDATFSTIPPCGTTGTITVTRPVGSYTVTGSCGSATWGPVTSTVAGSGDCARVIWN